MSSEIEQLFLDALDGFELRQPKSSVDSATCAVVEGKLADLLNLVELLFGHAAAVKATMSPGFVPAAELYQLMISVLRSPETRYAWH
ncbi:hypothetical protein [Rhizobium laguerreae]|uniref:hypothetical protein n=1 Tax=Rhizobium laguerreae TaxID=1076926 RepID=UPI001C91AE13|nr:hypothetical protein [Rhizobium laguerreae]MBY3434836.1 hypothetical protein [Rhizobium laguerreae]MBY3448979.1 hypothetical protein [Rhizobium laguerreae]MBY3456753.1 hypothetical protein [Rhizobium laguerreae]